jgi:hypothetical protein
MPKISKRQSLKMILSKSAGARFQMDLVQMPEFNHYNYILRAVDHLSKYGFVFPLKRRTAQEVGDGLLHILAASVGPQIFQSDNGLEFLGYCVDLINETFPWMHIVHGKPRKPSMQGSVEVSHRAFKAALVKWLDKENTANWVIGASVVQCEVNHYHMRSHSGMSLHTIYYGKRPTASYSALLSGAYKKARTEYGLRLAKCLLLQIKQMKPELVIPQEQVEEWVAIGDEKWSITMDNPDVDSEELLVVAFHECLVEAGITMEDGTEIVEDKYDTDTLPSDEERYDMEVDEIDHNPFWDNEDAHFTSVEGVAQTSDSAGATAPFLNNWDNKDAHFNSVEGVPQASDSAGAKEPFLNNWDNEDAYTPSLVGVAQVSDSAGATAPLFNEVQCSGVTAGEEINLDGGTAPSENHDVGRKAYIPHMHQTEAMEPLLADANCSEEAAEVFHGEGRGEEDTSGSKMTKESSPLVQNIGYYEGEPNSISQVGVSGREEPITNRDDKGDEWHKKDPPYEEERCSNGAICHADEEQQCIEN